MEFPPKHFMFVIGFPLPERGNLIFFFFFFFFPPWELIACVWIISPQHDAEVDVFLSRGQNSFSEVDWGHEQSLRRVRLCTETELWAQSMMHHGKPIGYEMLWIEFGCDWWWCCWLRQIMADRIFFFSTSHLRLHIAVVRVLSSYSVYITTH